MNGKITNEVMIRTAIGGVPIQELLLLLFMPLTQITLQYSLINIVDDLTINMMGLVAYLIADACFLAADIYLVIWVLTQKRRSSDTEKLVQIRFEIEQERIRYKELEEQREDIARLRHDYNNQLDTIRYLLREDSNAARDMTETLLRAVREEKQKTAGGSGSDNSCL